MVKRGWDAHVLGRAPHTFTDALTAVKTLRVGPAAQPCHLPTCPSLCCCAAVHLPSAAAHLPTCPALRCFSADRFPHALRPCCRTAAPPGAPPAPPGAPRLAPSPPPPLPPPLPQGTEEDLVSDQFVAPFVIVGEDGKPVSSPTPTPYPHPPPTARPKSRA
jgi:hypothetical protein